MNGLYSAVFFKSLNLLRAFAFIACFGFSMMALPQLADAQNIPRLGHPSTDWTVGPIGGSSIDDYAYCTMKNQFDTDKVLVFARNADGSSSIALDYQQDLFQKGQRYGIRLEVPPHVSRGLQAIAASKQVLIMQIGSDPAFFDAIRRKDKLNVAIDGQVLSFSLAGTAEGLTRLGDCVRDLDGGTPNPAYRARQAKQTTSSAIKTTPTVEQRRAFRAPSPIKSGASTAGSISNAEKGLLAELEAAKAAAKAAELEKQAVQAKLEAEQLKFARELGKLEADSKKHQVDASKYKKQAGDLKAEISSLQRMMDEKQAGISHEKNQVQQALRDQKLAFEREKAALERRLELASTGCAVTAEAMQTATVATRGQPNVVPTMPSSPDFLEELLVSAQIATSTGVHADFSPAPSRKAYSWSTDQLFGGATTTPWPTDKSFDTLVDDYLALTESRCEGDFAANRVPTDLIGSTSFAEAEIACIDNRDNAAAALFFYGADGEFTIIAHEGTADQMYEALAKRDAISTVLKTEYIN